MSGVRIEHAYERREDPDNRELQLLSVNIQFSTTV